MNVVYEVIDVPEENSLLRTAARLNVSKRLVQIQNILLDLNQDPSSRSQSEDHRKVYDLFVGINDSQKFRDAALNIRVQQGIKDRFELGLTRMTMYLDQIKRVLREGVPTEIAYLPLVESSFNNQSLSKTRAAGIWQFMPGTARLYMKVNSDVDERLDPYVATKAAARYLKRSYEQFGNWPVALMSYNHGQQGMRNAIRQVGTSDFMTIVNKYEGKYFGFASRNFYAEFLAACKVMKDSEKYFGSIVHARALTHESIRLSQPLWVSTIINGSSLTREDIRTYNPALQSSVIFSKRPIPAGYILRVPAGRVGNVETFIAKLRGGGSKQIAATETASSKSASNSRTSSTTKSFKKLYVVKKGDTLFSISQKFSTSVEILRKLNGLDHSRIQPGQKLFVNSP
jgi:peptidoglycan lytic transglycosylase D